MAKGVIIPRKSLQRLYQEAKDAHEQKVTVSITGNKLIACIGKKTVTIEETNNHG